MRFFFHHFYHSFAWTMILSRRLYPSGAGMTGYEQLFRSFKERKYWKSVPAPDIFNASCAIRACFPSGLDELMQMIHLAKHRLEKADYKTINLARGLAQTLPFPDAKFDSVISTFPSEYISDSNTLSEIHRVLRDDGHFIVLPAAWIVGRKFWTEPRRGYFKLPARRQRISSRSSQRDLFNRWNRRDLVSKSGKWKSAPALFWCLRLPNDQPNYQRFART